MPCFPANILRKNCGEGDKVPLQNNPATLLEEASPSPLVAAHLVTFLLQSDYLGLKSCVLAKIFPGS